METGLVVIFPAFSVEREVASWALTYACSVVEIGVQADQTLIVAGTVETVLLDAVVALSSVLVCSLRAMADTVVLVIQVAVSTLSTVGLVITLLAFNRA